MRIAGGRVVPSAAFLPQAGGLTPYQNDFTQYSSVPLTDWEWSQDPAGGNALLSLVPNDPVVGRQTLRHRGIVGAESYPLISLWRTPNRFKVPNVLSGWTLEDGLQVLLVRHTTDGSNNIRFGGPAIGSFIDAAEEAYSQYYGFLAYMEENVITGGTCRNVLGKYDSAGGGVRFINMNVPYANIRFATRLSVGYIVANGTYHAKYRSWRYDLEPEPSTVMDTITSAPAPGDKYLACGYCVSTTPTRTTDQNNSWIEISSPEIGDTIPY